MNDTRFSIMSTRYCNYMPTRTFDALMCGTLPLVDEDNGLPYIFSEWFACFCPYKRKTLLSEVEQHLGNYANIKERFQTQLPQFEKEFKCLFPDAHRRTERYFRHLLWMTKVEEEDISKKRVNKPTRKAAYFNEYDFFSFTPPGFGANFSKRPRRKIG